LNTEARASTPKPKQCKVSDLERRLIANIWTITFVVFVVALAAFSLTFLTNTNTFALADAVIRWFAPHASAEDISALHLPGRDLGHFPIPMVTYLALVLGPLRNHRYIAPTICAMFAVLDETLQASAPGRTGSIYEVAVEVAGALCGFFLYSVSQAVAAVLHAA